MRKCEIYVDCAWQTVRKKYMPVRMMQMSTKSYEYMDEWSCCYFVVDVVIESIRRKCWGGVDRGMLRSMEEW
jgi:hypothetical protein